jgi:hypothetical protein
MSKLKSRVYLILGLSLLTVPVFVLSLYFYYSYGAPWDYMSYKNKFETYLENKYAKEFVVEEMYFDFFHGKTYHAEAYVNDDPALKFYVGQHSGTKEIEDGYHSATWEKQAREELGPIIERLYPDKHNGGVQTYVSEEHRAIVKERDIPNYKNYTTVQIGISMANFEVTSDNRMEEIKRAYLLLMAIKEKGVKLDHFGVSYKNKTMQLQAEEILLIKSYNDLDKWLVDYLK